MLTVLLRSPSCEALKIAFTELYRLEDFDQREKLGAGFFGEVFRVVHRVTGRVLVLKMNRQGGSERERRELQSLARKEIQTLGRLEHPNLLRLEAVIYSVICLYCSGQHLAVQVCIHAGQLHALTEFMDGGTLEELLQVLTVFHAELCTTLLYCSPRPRCPGASGPSSLCRWRGAWSIFTARSVMCTMLCTIFCTVLCTVRQGMFHRDLTSKNVFLRQQPRTALIGDFGLATEIPGPGAARLPQVLVLLLCTVYCVPHRLGGLPLLDVTGVLAGRALRPASGRLQLRDPVVRDHRQGGGRPGLPSQDSELRRGVRRILPPGKYDF